MTITALRTVQQRADSLMARTLTGERTTLAEAPKYAANAQRAQRHAERALARGDHAEMAAWLAYSEASLEMLATR